ncbi:hypothetical protein HNR23_000738 [Nocardiopsis mwathae]|uniref:Subtilisin inhibitor domain-containing protein n=1 Tax=Nocardiopsis mwathae TaxID=1472723 RepID=A0A7W9YEG2_9ACTN|nr:hypothetical protein [Nocardiopsis mwathae]MBB6170678.1 hypothetical protein [Nocardiopsis mwathae]
MSKLNPHRRSPRSAGIALLASLCGAGAVGYLLVVGTSLVPLAPEHAVESEVSTVSELSPVPVGPVGRIQVHVTDRAQAYVQNLTCEGSSETDPAACARLGDLIQDAGGEDSSSNPFAEVSEDAVCTDKEYGPQEALITGVWDGVEIETTVKRTDSCEEARWERLRPLTEPLA